METTKCTRDHGGNKTLHRTAGGYLECAGCGYLYGEAPLGKADGNNRMRQHQHPLPQPKGVR